MALCSERGAAQRKSARPENALGERIRTRREKLGLSQDKVAEELGWFAAQVDDCERGLFVPPGRDLYVLADLLAVDVAYLNGGGRPEKAVGGSSADALLSLIQSQQGADEDPGGRSDPVDLFWAYSRIRDAKKRSLLLDLAQSFAQG